MATAVVVVLIVSGTSGGPWTWLQIAGPQVVSLAPLAAEDGGDGEDGGGDDPDAGDGDQAGDADEDDQAGDENKQQEQAGGSNNGDQQDQQQEKENEQGKGDDGGGADEQGQFAGRDKIGVASVNAYTPISRVQSNSGIGEGGDFSRGSYSIKCTLAGHHNSDNPIIAPGVRNGAQHMHDYAGNESTNSNSDSETLGAADTTCTNGDQTPLFWPVLRDLNGVGPDVGQDGGSLDGNVGSYVDPTSIGITFHGHGTEQVQPMPRNMILNAGSAKSATAEGEGANSKYSCRGFEDRVTERYPICPRGSALQRIYDFPSCWDGQNLDSEDHTTHLVYPDKQGDCSGDTIAVPALRMTIEYGDMPLGRTFAIDSFPDQQHSPITDHALAEYITSERRADAGADCINSGRDCVLGSESAAVGSLALEDQQPRPRNFGRALSTHARAHGGGHSNAAPHGPGRAPAILGSSSTPPASPLFQH